MTDTASTAPTDAEVEAARAVIAQRAAADAAAEAARVKPVTDFVASADAQTVRAALEALIPAFASDPRYGAHITCALTGLRGLGVPAPAAS